MSALQLRWRPMVNFHPPLLPKSMRSERPRNLPCVSVLYARFTRFGINGTAWVLCFFDGRHEERRYNTREQRLFIAVLNLFCFMIYSSTHHVCAPMPALLPLVLHADWLLRECVVDS